MRPLSLRDFLHSALRRDTDTRDSPLGRFNRTSDSWSTFSLGRTGPKFDDDPIRFLNPYSRVLTTSTDSSGASIPTRTNDSRHTRIDQLTLGIGQSSPPLPQVTTALYALASDSFVSACFTPSLFDSPFEYHGAGGSVSYHGTGTDGQCHSTAPQIVEAPSSEGSQAVLKRQRPNGPSLSFGCLMVKHSPQHYENIDNPCTRIRGLGTKMKHVREHCEIYHSRERRCMRCFKHFKLKQMDAFSMHVNDKKCKPVKENKMPQLFTLAQQKAFEELEMRGERPRDQAGNVLDEEQRWHMYFRALHPSSNAHDTISPWYDYLIPRHQIPFMLSPMPVPSGSRQQGQLLSETAAAKASPLHTSANLAHPPHGPPSLIDTTTASIGTADHLTTATPANSPVAHRLHQGYGVDYPASLYVLPPKEQEGAIEPTIDDFEYQAQWNVDFGTYSDLPEPDGTLHHTDS